MTHYSATQPDFGLFEGYVMSRPDLAPTLRDAFARRGLTFAVYTASDVAIGQYKAAGVTAYHLRQDPPGLVADGSPALFPLTIGGFVFPDLATFIDSEALYCYYPRWQLPLLRSRARGYLQRAPAWARSGFLPRRAMLSHVGAETLRLAMMHACELAGIPLVFFGAFPTHVRSHMYLHDDLWHTVHSRSQPLDSNLVDGLVDQLFALEQREPVTYPSGGGESRARRLVLAIRNRDYERIMWPLNWRSFNLSRNAFRSWLEHRLASSELPEAPFVFVPLHVINDAQTSIRNRQWLVQTDFVRHVAAAVPSGVTVAVKLHPGSAGLIPSHELLALGRLPNVRLISREVSPLLLIDHAVAVAIISSTAGFEALLRRKPTVVVGNWNYPETRYTSRAHTQSDIREMVVASLDWDGSRDEVRLALTAGIRDMYPGNLYVRDLDGDAIVASVLQFLDDRAEGNRGAPEHSI